MMQRKHEKLSQQVAFLGTGRMATALARGLVDSGSLPADRILGYDVIPSAREAFAEVIGGQIATTIAPLLEAEILILAVKPQQAGGVLEELAGRISSKTFMITIAAGLPISFYTNALGDEIRLVRVMPNTPCLVGAGASGYAIGGRASRADGELTRRILETVGLAVEVPETLLDAVTGLSGSGPAYAYQIIEALSDGGVRAGLPRAIATQLAAQTLIGAARMVLETEEHPGALKDAVTSPGGTTIAGIHELERGGLRATLMNAVMASAERSRELGAG